VVTNFRRNGERFENRVKLRAIRTNDGTLSHIIGIQLDVTREQSALESLARQRRRYESLIETQSGYIWLMNAEGELVDVPEKWLELAGLPSSSGPPDLAAIRSALTPEAADAFQAGWVEALRDVTPFEVIYQLPAQSRSPKWFLDHVTPVLDDENKLLEWIAASQEVTQLKRAEKEVERAAYEDRLTGLLSPEGFAQRLDEHLKERDLHPASPVVVVDIKAPREINNTQGYDVGDEVLREVARRLRTEVGESGLVARTGGDEFTVLAPLESQRTLRQLQKCMAAVFDVPLEIRGFAFHVEASFGYARIRSSAGDARKLMTDAALAMHQSQHNPAVTWTQYTKALEHQTRETVDMTKKLRQALGADQLELYYQPQVDLASGRIIAAEALLRWNHPGRGLLTPKDFLEVAEQSGQLHAIGEWICNNACLQARAIQTMSGTPVRISINLSSRQYNHPHLADELQRTIAETHLDPALLMIEIDERILSDRLEETAAVLHKLKAIGIGLTLDRFGSGLSSLTLLRELPFDQVKIDPALLQRAPGDENTAAITHTLISLARQLSLTVAAAGVETEDQDRFLRQSGCHLVQGHRFSEPVSSEQLSELFAEVRQGRRLLPEMQHNPVVRNR
jgi:diguanylate cyclase (GGDEF)-like protein